MLAGRDIKEGLSQAEPQARKVVRDRFEQTKGQVHLRLNGPVRPVPFFVSCVQLRSPTRSGATVSAGVFLLNPGYCG